MDAFLSHKVRKQFEKGKNIRQVFESLSNDYRKRDIQDAINDFYNDEAIDYDDKLIAEISKGLRQGRHIQDIYAELLAKEHKLVEIEKAILRSTVAENVTVPIAMRRWQLYSLIQVIILMATILLTVFYNLIFFIPVTAIIGAYVYAAMGIPKSYLELRHEFGIIPGIGYWARNGIFGYSGILGNYWNWRLIDPATVVSGSFFIIIFLTLFLNFASFTWFFVGTSLYLSLLSFYCFRIKPPETTGPPYNRITVD